MPIITEWDIYKAYQVTVYFTSTHKDLYNTHIPIAVSKQLTTLTSSVNTESFACGSVALKRYCGVDPRWRIVSLSNGRIKGASFMATGNNTYTHPSSGRLDRPRSLFTQIYHCILTYIRELGELWVLISNLSLRLKRNPKTNFCKTAVNSWNYTCEIYMFNM